MVTYDIVYILKKDIDSEELKYSIRSVVENFPYKRIIFCCGCPNDLKPDLMIPFNQDGYGKINKVIGTLKSIVNNDDISDDFWLFNDDFFVMKPYTSGLPWVNGTLRFLADKIENRNNNSRYVRTLRLTARDMEYRNKDILSYATHTPILINKRKAREILTSLVPPYSFRSAYGNYWSIGGTLHEDIKISDEYTIPDKDSEFLSTNDISFEKGEIGKYIRERFPNPSKYELAAFEEKTYCNIRE